MVEHSKLPWRYDTEDDDADIIAADGAMVAGMNMARGKTRDANAALIVAAVNSYHSTSARIAALEGALDGMVLVCGRSGDAFYDFEEQAEVFYQETGYMRPGKDVPMEMARDDEDERRAKYSAWVKTKLDAGRAALASTEAMKGE
jgi:hypothetical protein